MEGVQKRLPPSLRQRVVPLSATPLPRRGRGKPSAARAFPVSRMAGEGVGGEGKRARIRLVRMVLSRLNPRLVLLRIYARKLIQCAPSRATN